GESKWVTGEVAREHVHFVRAQYDAVAVGHTTFLSDDPSLNVRHAKFASYLNKAVLFDAAGLSFEKLASSKLFSVRPPENIIVVTADDVAKSSSPVRHLKVQRDGEGNFEMKQLLEQLKSEGLTSLLVEGGSYSYGRFFQAKAVQRLHAYVAPILIGGRHAMSWAGHFGGTKLADKIELKNVRRLDLGVDQYWTARI
ncbi:MAG: dihydrofolate reductase family protein, partial [Bdellovibrionota bacterium]